MIYTYLTFPFKPKQNQTTKHACYHDHENCKLIDDDQNWPTGQYLKVNMPICVSFIASVYSFDVMAQDTPIKISHTASQQLAQNI